MRRCLQAPCPSAAALYGGAAFAQTPVKIGVLSDIERTLFRFRRAGLARSRETGGRGFQRRLEKLSVEIVSADAQNKPDVATAIARRWFDTDNVDMVVDIPTSNIALGPRAS